MTSLENGFVRGEVRRGWLDDRSVRQTELQLLAIAFEISSWISNTSVRSRS